MVNEQPAFSAYRQNNQSITAATWTKVAFDQEEFDTNTNFASNRFSPTVAGYYQINATVYFSGSASASVIYLAVYKNGAAMSPANFSVMANSPTTNISDTSLPLCTMVYCNGSTDYIEIYGWSNATSPYFAGGATRVSGFLARAA